jgi:hypothetical protein
VKCDETRPVCLRCTSGWHVCDGYATVTPVVGGPSFDIHGSPQSKRSFAFFVQRTSTQLAGFFGSDFWERHVLQAAYHESAVCHAIVAIGSLHELSEQQVVITDTNKSFALEQYNLAIRDLLVPLSQNGKRGIDVCLIACVLFTCIEVDRSHSLHGRSQFIIHSQKADPIRTCKDTMHQQFPTSKVVRSYCKRPCMMNGIESFNTKYSDQKATWIPTPL